MGGVSHLVREDELSDQTKGFLRYRAKSNIQRILRQLHQIVVVATDLIKLTMMPLIQPHLLASQVLRVSESKVPIRVV